MSQENLLEAKILLTDPYARWTEVTGQNGLRFQLRMRGYARLGARYFQGDELCAKVHEVCAQNDADASVAAIKALIPSLDGGWALVAQWADGRVLAATDRMRTIPLFWTVFQNQLVVADSALECAQAIGQSEIDEQAALEFVLAGYVTGDQTLFQGIHQIQSGEIIEFNPRSGETIERHRYYRFYPTEKSTKSEAELERELVAVLDDVFSAFARSLDGEQIVVPLSGGLDSRLVAGMLHRHHVPNVTCFTYGDPQGDEEQISQRVSQALGYPWKCVVYDGPLWQRWREDARRSAYVRFLCKGCSTPHLQDFPAVMYLVENGDLKPDNTIAFPGHSGDMVAGSHLPVNYQALERSPQRLTQKIWNKHYRNWPVESPLGRPEFRGILQKIEQLSAKPASSPIDSPCAQSEMWDAECRQAAYIINSVRCYEFAGMRWRTLWDYPLMDFFLTVPNELRFGERLYVNTLRERLFIGEESALASIPISGMGDWSGSQGLKKPEMRGQVVRSYLRMLLRRFYQLSKGRPMEVNVRWEPGTRIDPYVRLFGCGFEPDSTYLRDVFQELRIWDAFPDTVQSFLETYSEYRPHEIKYFGLACAIALGEYLSIIKSSGIDVRESGSVDLCGR